MKYNMFSIYDEKAKAYLPPFVLPETGMAIRTFSDCVNSRDHQFSKHPGDYTLYQVAIWTDDDGSLQADQIQIGNGLQYKQPEQELNDEPQT